MIFLKRGNIPNLKKLYLCESYFSPRRLQAFTSYNMAEFQNRLCFINATKCRNSNTPDINITFCCCQDAQQAACQLLLFLLPLSHQAADMFCSKVCKCKSPGSFKFCASLLVEVTLNAVYYIK